MPYTFVFKPTGKVSEVPTPAEAYEAALAQGHTPKSATRVKSRQVQLINRLDEAPVWDRGDAGMDAEVQRRVEEALANANPLVAAAGPAPTQTEVRAWAVENGIDVPRTGRLPEAVVEQYKNRR